MLRLFIILAAPLLLAFPTPVAAQSKSPIKLIRDAALSPDGAALAFSWRGDIWRVASQGGAAQRLTFHPSLDQTPAFSPDGEEIAFVSNRTGSRQIFVMPASGGQPRQITLNTEGYRLLEWTPDGKGFLVSARRDQFWRPSRRLFLQARDGQKAPTLLFDGYGSHGRLSPDGHRLLFTREGAPTWRKHYQGSEESQIWLFDLETHQFRQLKGEGEGGCRWPLWADAEHDLYVSQKTGTWNLFKSDIKSGKTRQITHATGDGVTFPALSRDGSTLVYLRLFDLHILDLKSGADRQIEIWDSGDPTVLATRHVKLDRATQAGFTHDAREMAFIAGGDLFVMDTVLKEPVRVTNTPAEEHSPVFSKDMQTLYFLSETKGQVDLFAATRQDPEKPWWQNTAFNLKPVTHSTETETSLRLWDDGKKLAFVVATGDLKSLDRKTGQVSTLIASWNPPSFDFSPDNKWIVYSIYDQDYNSDVWIKPVDGSKPPFNVSVHPDNDSSPKWSADGRVIAWTGRRWDRENDITYVFLAKEKSEETSRERRLQKALKKMKGRQAKGPASKPARKQPGPLKSPSPSVSGHWEGTVKGPPTIIPGGSISMTMELKETPDGHVTGHFEDASGGQGELSGTFDKKSGALHFVSESDNGRIESSATLEGNTLKGTWTLVELDIHGTWTATRLQNSESKTAAAAKEKTSRSTGSHKAKKKVQVRIDFEGLRDRVRRLSIPNSRERGLLFAPTGEKLYFHARVGNRSGYYSVTFPDQLHPSFWTSDMGRGARWLDKQTLGTLLGSTPATLNSAGKATRYAFSFPAVLDVAARNQAIFYAAWRTMRDRFYDERLGNNDWNVIARKYARMAATVDGDTLTTVTNMMLGELNASHLGFYFFDRGGASRGPAQQWAPVTGHLGVRFDPAFEGPGLLVKDVIPDTPAAREDSRIRAGEVLLQIDGQPLHPGLEIATLLTGPRQRSVRVLVRNQQGQERTVAMRPTTYGAVRSALYKKWIGGNRKQVDQLSGGHLGYLHIRAMGFGNLLTFDQELYKIGHGKQGIIIDVRENGGGSITDRLLTCLCQPTHAITRGREGSPGYPQDRRVYATWDKPIVVLCNQNSFSNAEIFAHAIKTLKRGKLVGVTTAGGVISTGSASLMGVARIRVPMRGWYLLDGEDMERNGARPDFLIWPRPGELPAGIDRQLEKAVQVLKDEVRASLSHPRPRLRKASERNAPQGKQPAAGDQSGGSRR